VPVAGSPGALDSLGLSAGAGADVEVRACTRT